MSAELKTKKLTPEEYLELEEQAEYRSEYWDGVMIPVYGEPPELSGATENHNLIVTNLIAAFRGQLRSREWQIFATDMKVWVEKYQKFFYPDVMVVCDERKFYNNRRNVIENPNLIVEVLSKSTGLKDKTHKLWAYQSLESLQEYVLISQNEFVVERYFRQQDQAWGYSVVIGSNSFMNFQSINVMLSLSEIYDLVEFEESEKEIL